MAEEASGSVTANKLGANAEGTVWSVCFLDETNKVFNSEYRLVIACADSLGKISIFGNLLEDTTEWELVTNLTLKSDYQENVVIYSIKAAENGNPKKILVACDDNSFREIEYLENRSLVEKVHLEQAHLDDLNDVCYGKGNEKIYTVSDDKALKIWG